MFRIEETIDSFVFQCSITQNIKFCKKFEIFSLLTFRQADAYFRHKYLHIQKTEIARYLNITEGAVRKLIKKAEVNLQKYRLANEKEVKLLEAIFGSVL